MSDSDGDFSDELLALAGAGDKKRKRSQHRPAGKRRKAEYEPALPLHPLKLTIMFFVVSWTFSSHSASSGNEYESEDDFVNPYPLEGKYKDEEDRLQ